MTGAYATPEPCLIVILGATGDLMRRKLLPALARLAMQGLLHERTRILGAARSREQGDHSFRAWAREAMTEAGVAPADQTARWCDERLYYQAIPTGKVADYRVLGSRIEAIEREAGLPGNRIFYLALPPEAVPGTINGLGQAKLNRSSGWTRIVLEKPFGRDLASAQELNRLVHQHFDESQVYRIDHYLGKETVQNLLVFRFANPIFETLWNRDRVEHVQITVAEEIGIEGRAGYYDHAGALRDVVQNHVTQLLTLVAMEIPGSFDADPIRNEKVKVLQAVAPIAPNGLTFGQYSAGRIDGSEASGYRQEPGVAPDSQTETYAALRLQIENWRWHGVPFYLRAGKRLPRRLTQIIVTFRRPPVSLFPSIQDSNDIQPNVLAITIQPDEGFELWFEVKAPGQEIALQAQRLDFRYAEAFSPLADAYETLLLDVLTGDQTLFVRADEVEAAWRLYTPVLQNPPPVDFYPAGAWGPAAAEQLLAKDGHRWNPT
ncbi:MAG: glucose-6-phosphate dehydrogenase [Armatimonadota bacterium]